MLELLQYHSHPAKKDVYLQPSNQLGCSHIALTVGSIDKTLECVHSCGGSLVNQPATSPDGTVRVAYYYDSEGNLLELVEEIS